MSEKRLILVTGGARSGKSTYAMRLADGLGKRVLYVATAEASDGEMESRIENHQKQRPTHWETAEVTGDLKTAAKDFDRADVILVDCLTLLVSNILLKELREKGHGPWVKGHDSCRDKETWEDLEELERIERKVTGHIQDGLASLMEAGRTAIVVTNEVGMGIVPAFPLGRLYRDIMGAVNQQVAAGANEVYFLVSGIPVKVKG